MVNHCDSAAPLRHGWLNGRYPEQKHTAPSTATVWDALVPSCDYLELGSYL